jgi:serine protease Do
MMRGLRSNTRIALKVFVFGLVGVISFQLVPHFLFAGVFDEMGEEVNAVFEKARPAIVKVRETSSGAGGMVNSGTGFFIDGKGTLVSTSAVVGPDNMAIVTYDGVDVPAKAIGTDNRTGMALLQIDETNTPFLTLGTTNDLKTGYPLICIGFPLNLPLSPSYGFISGEDIRYLDKYFPTTLVHANITASPGEPGAPVLKTNGSVAGLYVNTFDNGRTIYILPSEAMQKVIGDFKLFGKLKQGWVGVIVDEHTDAPDSRTVNVKECAEGSPAAGQGIVPGDTVMRIDSKEIFRPSELVDAGFFSHPGDTMNVAVRRDNEMLQFQLPLIERPESDVVPTHVDPSAEPAAADPMRR